MVSEEDLFAVKSELYNHIELTKNEPGCLEFHVNQRSDNATIFDVYEEFKDISSFELHQARVKSSVWGRVTKSVQRYYEVTKVVT